MMGFFSGTPTYAITNMSAGQSHAQTSSHAPSCKWCDALLTSGDYKEGVCSRCYSLLSGAGITDEEIFSRKVQDKEPFPPANEFEKQEKRA
jgi:hypothetical protein